MKQDLLKVTYQSLSCSAGEAPVSSQRGRACVVMEQLRVGDMDFGFCNHSGKNVDHLGSQSSHIK